MRISPLSALLLLLAGPLCPPCLAFEMESAWSRSSAPLAADGAFHAAAASDRSPPADLGPFADGADAADADDAAGVLDEVRLGATVFGQGNDEGSEDGAFVTGQVLFDPFASAFANPVLDVLLRPRPHVGASVATGGGTSQVFAGLTWTVPIPPLFFLEASFGGTLHDGETDSGPLALGCRLLFREGVGAGLALGRHWRIVAGIDHSSHAGLCGGDNDGLTHIGGSVGYRF
jgi:hypothetical protein